ncbi:hypothetical protein [Rhizobium halophilum]|uniref:hypothetical protein n=1 Tax=Rhizobium halophilum TaxID=2846852 RepID=UPI001EFEC29C|nr:hypothetical protein [Rhizobium halophilum]MCF6369747.1 hypothetical protein [Rhizobium halophilum]
MIIEALQFAATTPVTPSEFRPFVGSSVSLWSRATRCKDEWAAHEENCRRFIADTIGRMRQRRTAVVLGSGLLRDVPIQELSSAFDTVVLVDLVHLASVRMWLQAKRLGNVRLVHRDLSGLGDALAGKLPEPLSFLRQVPYLDLVVSANLLSQIGVGAERRLEQAKDVSPADVVSQLIEAHLGDLTALPCTTILLTDVAYRIVGRSGETLESADLMHGVPAPDADEHWPWPVVPFGEQGRDYQIVHQVIAKRILR